MTESASRQPQSLDLDAFEPPEFLLATLNSRIRDLMNTTLRQHGLKLVEWRVLQCLSEADGPRTVAELAELTVIDRTVASRLVDKMAARGLVHKQAMAQDRRFVSITASQAGRDLYQISDEAAQDARRRLFDGMTDADVQTLLDLLSRMHTNAASPVRQVQPAHRTRRMAGR